MKRKNIFRISSLAFLTAAIFTSCSDSFLEKKQSFFCNRLVDKT